MNSRFESILIGAGPAAVAGLCGLKPQSQVAVVTGAVPGCGKSSEVHPKIRVVAMEAGEAPGLSAALPGASPGVKPLFPTAAVGGLANYWGQQFLRYHAADPYPADIFPDYQSYADACTAIEGLFSLAGGVDLPRPHLPAPGALAEDYRFALPRLLTGSAGEAALGLRTMRRVAEASMSATTVLAARAQRIAQLDDGFWEVQLSDGRAIAGRKIWLAAGVIGTAQLLLSSFPVIAEVSFLDHAPYMAYTTGLRGLLKSRPATATRHFNALTIERVSDAGCTLFASLYDMSAAELNLLLASTIGQAWPMFKGWPAPPGASWVQPVQIWTNSSFARLTIDAASGRISGEALHGPADATLDEAVQALRTLGGTVRHLSTTAPGLGFHYHGTTIKLREGGQAVPLDTALAQWSGGAVSCIDPSILRRIGLRPHTLTAMATARRLVAAAH